MEWGGCGFFDVEAGTSRWHALGSAEIRQVVQTLRSFFSSDPPDLHGVIDTSNGGSITQVTGALGRDKFHFSFDQMSSGYRGTDAAAFAEFCRALLLAARLPQDDLRYRRLLQAR